MKKISSLVISLAILSFGTAFALELPDALKIPGLTVTGDVRTGLRVDGATYDNFGENDVFLDNRATGAVDPSVYAYSDDLGDGTPFRAQLQLVWERDNLGVKTRFRYRPDGDRSYAVGIDTDGDKKEDAEGSMKVPGTLDATLANLNNTINKAFVYGWLLDKKVKVSVGKGTDEAWGLFYSNYATTTGFDGKDGVKVDVLPIEGLSLGVHYGTDDLFAKAVNDGGFNDQGSMYRRFVAGVKYTADSFGVVASTVHNFVEYSYELKDDKGKDIFIKEDWNEYVDKPLPNTSNVLFGLWVAPIEPLRIDLSVAAVNLGSKTKKAVENDKDMSNEYKKGDYNPYWFVLPKLKAEYTVNEQLGIGLEIGDILFADEYYYKDADATDPEDKGVGGLFPITISPSATYAINDDVTAGLELGFKINSGASDQFGIGFKPSAEFSLGSGATFVVWDELTFWIKSNDSAEFIAKHPLWALGGNGGAGGTTNSLQFDFVWTF